MIKTSVLDGLCIGTEEIALQTANWASSYIRLGGALALRSGQIPPDEQLILVVTAPVRDYVCSLIAVGWALTRPLLSPPSVASTALATPPGTLVRATTDVEVIEDRFHSVETKSGVERIRIGGSAWKPERIRSLEVLEGTAPGHSGRRSIPPAGSLSTRLNADRDWNWRQASGTPHTLMVGSMSTFNYEAQSLIGFQDSPPDRIGDILQPDSLTDVAPRTQLASSRNILDLHASRYKELCLFDGASATRWLDVCLSKIVIVAIDRSNIDPTSFEDIRRIRTVSLPRSIGSYGLRAPGTIELSAMSRPF